MNTFIISANNFEKSLEKAQELNKKNKIDKFDVDIKEFEKALGIEDVRNIQKTIFLKPFKGEKKSTIIYMRNSATVDAQNAMLKLLEEPPPSSMIILITNNYHSFLPTILSRAKIIEIKEEIKIDPEAINQILELDGEGGMLYLASKISEEKTEAINFLEQSILGARDEMLKQVQHNKSEKALKLRKIIHKLELAHYDLKTTNTNTRLTMENLFLNI